MKAKLLYIMMVLLLSTLQSCGQQKVESKAYQTLLQGLLSHNVPEVLVSDSMIKDSNIIFLDAREKTEYEVSHLNKAIWVGYDDFNVERVKDIPKTAEVIVYCSVGYRSEKVAQQLKENGFTNVSNLYGGIFEWKNQGHPVVDDKREVTDSIHAFDKTWGIWLKKGIRVY